MNLLLAYEEKRASRKKMKAFFSLFSLSPIQSSSSARVKLSKGAREWVGEVSLAYELSPGGLSISYRDIHMLALGCGFLLID